VDDRLRPTRLIPSSLAEAPIGAVTNITFWRPFYYDKLS
jgi:hypothetical protein